MSMCMLMSGFNSNADASTSISDENSKFAEKYKNAKQLLTDTAFVEIEANADYKIKPTENSFGVIPVIKRLPSTVRKNTNRPNRQRDNYEFEWNGNFKVGETGKHQGLTEGRDKAYNRLTS